MEVSNKVKSQYHQNSIHKNIVLFFPDMDLTINNTNINYESMKLKESLLDADNIEFVGCIASVFRITLNGINQNIKGQKIQVSVHTDQTEDEPVRVFNGIVDSAVKQSNKQDKEIIAYDELYTKGNIEVSSWYNSLDFPISLKDLRDSLFEYIGITQEEKELPNDSVLISKQYDPKSLQALSVIKAVCQINGAFGIINRDGNFEYRILGRISNPYPSMYLFPSNTLFPANPSAAASAVERIAGEVQAENFSFYKKVDYEEYEVKPVDKLTIRQSENDAGVTYGAGTNNYIIQGNMFTYGLSESTLREVAANIYPNVRGFSYHPFTSENNGLPFLECGKDAVSYTMIDYENSTNDNIAYNQQEFYILNRELTGIQALRDSYGANGEEYQTEFVTDLQTQIDIIKMNSQNDIHRMMEDYTYDKDTIDMMVQSGGGTGDFKVISVKSVPSSYESNALYVVQGEVFVQ
ncbi:MAG: hypothetical protein J6K26_09355 [Lachnospiraceae bacterium]|nr:hypothetical protein [Lachnospiraceae bacterium]